MPEFETNPKSLKDLLNQINMGELALPNFQRDFVWDPGATVELVESIMRKYPAGSLLFLRHDGRGFDVREFEGRGGRPEEFRPSYLVLDGQQRLTSLFQAFYGKGDYRFFLDIGVLGENGDLEEAIWHEPLARARRRTLDAIETQARELICPLEVVLGRSGGFHSWIDAVVETREKAKESPEVLRELRAKLRQVSDGYINPILEYRFPVITLPSNTSMDAVCTMFETLNRTGVKLSVFELLMARAFADKVSLRTLWSDASGKYPKLGEFEINPYYLLQVICLWESGSIKRSDVLDLSPESIAKNWPEAVSSMSAALTFMQATLGVLAERLVPYGPMTITLASVWRKVEELKGPEIGAAKSKLAQWFWASVFMGAYEKSPNSRVVLDHDQLLDWLSDGEEEPRTLRGFYFTPEQFLDISPKQRALYRGALCLVNSGGALDFHNGDRLTYSYLIENGVDDHHIFPQNFLKKRFSPAKINCVANRTLIDTITNIRISDQAPSKYLGDMSAEMGEPSILKILESHAIPIDAMKTDDFEQFLRDRSALLFGLLKSRIGREIPNVPPKIEDEEELEEDISNPRDRLAPELINEKPTRFLNGHPPIVAERFDRLVKEIQSLDPAIWWKLSKNRISFYSPQRMFMAVRISKYGLSLRVFTRGQEMSGVTPITQRDDGGKLWGRTRYFADGELPSAVAAVKESLERIRVAVASGEGTSWWAARDRSRNKAA